MENIQEHSSTMIHRDISWLSFNERVLQEAKDKRNPLLERLKFLGIYSKNIDEFFHVRMAYHLNLVRINKSTRKKLDYNPKKLIKQIIEIANVQQIEFSRIFEEEIRPELKLNGISLITLESINETQKEFIVDYFHNTLRLYVEPVLMRGKKINPFLKDGSLYLGVHFQDGPDQLKEVEYGLVRIPSDLLPRFIELPTDNNEHHIIMLDEVLRYGLVLLFPGFKIKGSYSFKLTRDAELYIGNQISGNLKEAIKKSLSKRQIGRPARFVYDRNMPVDLLDILSESFDLNKYDRIKAGKYQNLSDLLKFPSFGKSFLKNKPLGILTYPAIEESYNPFNSISSQDHYIHPPYHSFESVIRFFEYASTDLCVTEIYITQYRIGQESRILNALITAAQHSIKVTVFVEVQARFDEELNLFWGERLEQAGVNVIYSIQGIKVHSKIGHIVRVENDKAECFSILSTGNFHEGNSSIYSDLCLFTSDKRICQEVNKIFQYLQEPGNKKPIFQHLLVGKFNLRQSLYDMIEKEIEQASIGKEAHIVLKMNSLEDPEIITKLYEASKAKVKIELIVRGICCLVPGIVGLSENIRVVSIIDRYLEHARIYYFHNAGSDKLYLSSADWMTRNLSRRIEAAFPIYSPAIKKEIIQMLQIQLSDNVKARLLDAEQKNSYVKNNKVSIQAQETIHQCLATKTNTTPLVASDSF